MKTLAVSLAAAFLACTSAAHAQVGVGTTPTYGSYGPYGYYRPDDFGGGLRYQHHASTAYEGALRGSADLIRGWGQYNLLTAEAARAAAAAREHEIQNRQDGVKAYFSIRDFNNQQRKAARGERPTQDELRQIAAVGVPDPLSPSDIDWISGAISWPVLLEGDEFAPYRGVLEGALAERASQGRMQADTAREAEEAADLMLEELKSHVREVSPQKYITARRFIESLAHEVRQPTG